MLEDGEELRSVEQKGNCFSGNHVEAHRASLEIQVAIAQELTGIG